MKLVKIKMKNKKMVILTKKTIEQHPDLEKYVRLWRE